MIDRPAYSTIHRPVDEAFACKSRPRAHSSRVGVRGTTTEHFGFTGRGEDIAAQAVWRVGTLLNRLRGAV